MRRIVLLLATTVLGVLLFSGAMFMVADKPVEAAFPGENGKIAFTTFVPNTTCGSYGQIHIASINADGSNRIHLSDFGSTYGDNNTPSWSPDGTRIAFAHEEGYTEGLGENEEIYVMDADGSNKTKITNTSGFEFDPAWSPDGTKVAFTYTDNTDTDSTGLPDIYVMDADGSNRTRLTGTEGNDHSPSWSPDGTRIAFSRDGEVYTMNADGSDQTRLTSSGGASPNWSPDGTKIVFRKGSGIVVMNADGSNEVHLGQNGYSPVWSPDGTRIAFAKDSQVYVMDADGSNPVRITGSLCGSSAWDPDWQPVHPQPDSTPPETTVESKVSSSTTASFSFSSSEPRSTFECSLDGAAFTPCASPAEYTGLSQGGHNFEVRATDKAGNTDPTPASRAWTVDSIAPLAQPPAQSFAVGSTLGTSTTVPVNLSWSATDAGSGVESYELQRSTDGGPYSAVALPSATSTTLNPSLVVGSTYRYRVSARDGMGNVSAWKLSPSFTVDRRQERNGAIAYTGTWRLQALSNASGGYTKYATASGATAKFTFAGRNVAWVAPRASNFGKATVWVDGVKVKTVDLYSPTYQPRRVVFSKSWSTSSTHTLRVKVSGTKNASSTGTRVDVDAFVALR